MIWSVPSHRGDRPGHILTALALPDAGRARGHAEPPPHPAYKDYLLSFRALVRSLVDPLGSAVVVHVSDSLRGGQLTPRQEYALVAGVTEKSISKLTGTPDGQLTGTKLISSGPGEVFGMLDSEEVWGPFTESRTTISSPLEGVFTTTSAAGDDPHEDWRFPVKVMEVNAMFVAPGRLVVPSATPPMVVDEFQT